MIAAGSLSSLKTADKYVWATKACAHRSGRVPRFGCINAVTMGQGVLAGWRVREQGRVYEGIRLCLEILSGSRGMFVSIIMGVDYMPAEKSFEDCMCAIITC